MTALPFGYERRYVKFGRLAHYVDIERQSPKAVCGYGPSLGYDYWLGAGDQAEYERARAALLPPCKKCERFLFPEGGTL